MEGLVVYDNLKWAKEKDILSVINKEILYYSNKIIKTNHFNIDQERNIILTDEALYNFQKKKVKRKIKYDQIRGITFSKQNTEFVVHGNDDEYDYLFRSSERDIILSFIAKLYEEQNGKTLKLCEVNEKSLKNYVTGKKEKKKDKNYSKMDESKKIDTKKFLYDIANSNKKLRTSSNHSVDEEKIKDETPIQIKSKTIFSKINNITNANLEDFKILKILGRGEFGKVYLVRYKQQNEYYAMKSIKKECLVDENEIKNLLIEKKMLQNLNNPFLIGTRLCFTTNERIYFIMNLIQGESLSEYMRINKNKKEDQVKIYSAIIGLTIDYLHKNGIKYRDIRPDNIIIEKNGYLKIADFKMSQLFKLKNNSLITKETSEYLAPEVINSDGGKTESDWWTFGIIIYELLFDIPPYFNEDDTKIREQIIKNELRFPKGSTVSKGAKELIKKLLNKNPSSRLGHSKGFDEIKNQEFFKGLKFDDLNNKKLEISYKPSIGDILKDKEKYIEVPYDDLINSKILNK
jgi:serum/glucocorticoid-regulated kinase 2